MNLIISKTRRYQISINKFVSIFARRSNEVAPDAGDGGNQAGSESDKDKQGDCQRAKQVPMNPPAGT